MDEVTMPTRSVAGLQVPIDLVPRIISALRAEYPTLTDSIEDDEAAVRAVLHHWITSTMATHESKKAQEPLPDVLQATRDQYREAGIAAREKAIQDAKRITGAPTV